MTPAKIDAALLSAGAREFQLDLTPAQLDQFSRYADLLMEWNERFNLTSITDPREIVIKHFLDSLSVAPRIPAGSLKLIDMGAGAGLPGLPIKLARPNISLTLLEATRKKCDFLRAVIEELKLDHTSVVNTRAEEAGRTAERREQYDIAVARAVADLPVLAEYLLPFVKVGGAAIAQKAGGMKDEVDRAETAILLLGGLSGEIVRVRVPGLDTERTLIIMEKIARTPDDYPRRTGVPSKKPL